MTIRPGTHLKPLSQGEFIALIAMLFATVAFSIDSMLPALPEIAAELTPGSPNRAQLIVTSFVLGMGIGTFFTGPLSDAFGRKPVIIGGAMLYALGALAAWSAPTLELLLAARILQGLGIAGARIVSMAMVRDMFAGREMARMISFAMMVFILVPAVAPALGLQVISLFGWRALFIAFVVFATTVCLWLGLRQPETLPPEKRRPLRIGPLTEALREVFSHPTIRLSILVQALIMGMLFGTLSSTQQVFDQSFGLADSFPYWFAVIALMAGLSNVVNARLVVRVGMRRMITWSLGIEMLLSLVFAGLMAFGLWPEPLHFPAYLFWTISVFFTSGVTIGNLNALALEPVGHIAGMATSLVVACSTVIAVCLAAPLGLAFDGTPVPLMIGVSALCAGGFVLMKLMPKRVAGIRL